MEKSRSGAASDPEETGSDRAQWSSEVTDRNRFVFLILKNIRAGGIF